MTVQLCWVQCVHGLSSAYNAGYGTRLKGWLSDTLHFTILVWPHALSIASYKGFCLEPSVDPYRLVIEGTASCIHLTLPRCNFSLLSLRSSLLPSSSDLAGSRAQVEGWKATPQSGKSHEVPEERRGWINLCVSWFSVAGGQRFLLESTLSWKDGINGYKWVKFQLVVTCVLGAH